MRFVVHVTFDKTAHRKGVSLNFDVTYFEKPFRTFHIFETLNPSDYFASLRRRPVFREMPELLYIANECSIFYFIYSKKISSNRNDIWLSKIL